MRSACSRSGSTASAGGREFYQDVWQIAPALRPLKQDVVGGVGNVLWVVFGTVGIVLLIACANVTNLLLVRAEGRERELAVRAALGAGSWRIARDVLLETVSLAALGGALGLAFAYGALGLLARFGPTTLPRLARDRARLAGRCARRWACRCWPASCSERYPR